MQDKGRKLNLSTDDQKKMSCAVWNNRDAGGSDHMGSLRELTIYCVQGLLKMLLEAEDSGKLLNKARTQRKRP
ncbi:hypothetical protein DY000_02002598 [Brassica cretica]|uniref:Uncharacterized protein n=1 Tax=Brassica cretica TaxID=69181 RepID=A0ABQ7CG38_BRACR|nr:hypothetical protein DY000_02002598 [Brassica cretica]